MIPVTIVGGGDVLSRYLQAALACATGSELRIAHVVDVLPPAAIRRRHRVLEDFADPPELLRLGGESPADLLALLGSLAGKGPVVIATPTPYHLGQALACLEAGLTVGVEKPYVATLAEAERLDGWLRHHGDGRLFLFGYYLLEKGLPLVPLARRGVVPAGYLDELSPAVPGPVWAELRDSLGALQSVAGCIFEGSGAKATLRGREWVLDGRSGGITFEQLYHLVCLTLMWAGPDPVAAEPRVRVEDVLLLRDSSIPRHAAETFVIARLRLGDGVPVLLGTGKYVPPGLHERWMRLSFERGVAFADFEKRVLTVSRVGAPAMDIGLWRRAPYAPQWKLFEAKVEHPSLPSEYPLSLAALRLTTRLHSAGLAVGIRTSRIEPAQVPTLHHIFAEPASGVDLRAALAAPTQPAP